MDHEFDPEVELIGESFYVGECNHQEFKERLIEYINKADKDKLLQLADLLSQRLA